MTTLGPATGELPRVAELARNRLHRMARGSQQACRESLLFRQDHLVGLKVVLGPFVAQWFFGHPEIRFMRHDTPVGTLTVDGSSSSQAA